MNPISRAALDAPPTPPPAAPLGTLDRAERCLERIEVFPAYELANMPSTKRAAILVGQAQANAAIVAARAAEMSALVAVLESDTVARLVLDRLADRQAIADRIIVLAFDAAGVGA